MFFCSPNSKDAIKTDNHNSFYSVFGTEYKGYYSLDKPLFPQIYLHLIKFPHADYEQGVREYFLISNACKAPFLFDSVFKYLALDVYKVPRLDLGPKLDRYEDFHYLADLNGYQFFMQAAYAYFGLELFAMIFTILVVIDELTLSLYGYNPIISGGLIVITLTLLHVIVYYHYKYKFERFDEYNSAALKRFSQIAVRLYHLLILIFGLEAKVCLRFLQK